MVTIRTHVLTYTLPAYDQDLFDVRSLCCRPHGRRREPIVCPLAPSCAVPTRAVAGGTVNRVGRGPRPAWRRVTVGGDHGVRDVPGRRGRGHGDAGDGPQRAHRGGVHHLAHAPRPVRRGRLRDDGGHRGRGGPGPA